MDFKHILFSPNGRINRQPYWIATAIMFGVNLVAGLIPLVNFIVGIGMIYVSVCLYTKRLHDLGKTGWLQLIVWIGGFGAAVAGVIAMIPMIIALGQSAGDQRAVMAAMMASGIGALGLLGLSAVIGLGFHIVVGAIPGEKGENRYGPDPLNPVDTEAFV